MERFPAEVRLWTTEHAAADHVPGGGAEPQPRTRGVSRWSTDTAARLDHDRGPGPARRSMRTELRSRRPRLQLGDREDQRPGADAADRPGLARLVRVQQRAGARLPGRRRLFAAGGVGIWGIQIPIAWGFAITNFVWWIGIGHAGTLISAILLLMHQKWRTSINRFAEAMTIFAVMCAGLFPLLHMGRPWFFYWLLPYPNTMGLWPQFRSPLVWDVFAVRPTYRVAVVLVHGHDSRPGHLPRPGHRPPGRR